MKIQKENYLLKRLKSIIFTLYNRLENNNRAEFSVNGEEKFLDGILSSFGKDIVVFDIGANVGNYTQIIIDKSLSAKLNYKIHLFEPTKNCFSILQKKFSADKNVFLNNFGVSDHKGSAPIYYDEVNSGLSSLYNRDLSYDNVFMDKSESILLETLHSYIAGSKISKINLLKIDIEGHELNAFKGMGEYLNSSFIDAIQFEYGNANLASGTTLQDFYHLFLERDFSIYKIMRNHLELRPYHKFMENFQYANYVALSNSFIAGLKK